MVAFLFWVYVSAQIFYFGAEFTKAWSRRQGGVATDGLLQGRKIL